MSCNPAPSCLHLMGMYVHAGPFTRPVWPRLTG